MQFTEGSKNIATSDLRGQWIQARNKKYSASYEPLQLQLSKTDIVLLISVSSRAKLDILEIFRISESELRRLVETLHNMLQIIMKWRIGEEI